MKFIGRKHRWIALFWFILFTAVVLMACSNEEKQDQDYLKSAEAYLAKNKLKEAEIELKNVLQNDSANEYAYVKLSEVYRRLNDPKKELTTLIQVVNLNPDNMDAQHRLGQVYLLGSETQRARETANLILKKEPDNTKALHLLATAQVQERNTDAALKTINKAIDIEPENPHLYAFLGYLFYYGKNDFEKSEEAYLKAISLDSEFSEPYEELVRIYTMQGLKDNAEKLLIAWTKTPGNLQQKFVLLGGFYESQNNLKSAETTYEKLVAESEKKDPAPVHILGQFYARTGQFPKAVTSYKQTLAMEKNSDIQAELANIYFDMKEYSNAQNQVSEIIGKDSNHSQARLIDCKLLIVKELYNDALEKLEQLIAIDKDMVEAYYLKAVCLTEEILEKLPAQEIQMAATGDLSVEIWKQNQAIVALRSAIDLSPNYFTARMMLADLYVRTNNFIQAEKQLQYALNRFPNHTGALLMYGNLKIQNQEWEDAKRIFLRLIETKPDFSLAYVKLGSIFDSMGNPEEAIVAYQKALDLEPLNMGALAEQHCQFIHAYKQERIGHSDIKHAFKSARDY